MGRKYRVNSKRLKWAGLVPLREPRESIAALEEMIDLGSSAVVVFGTARDKMLSDPSFTPFWDDFARTKLPLCVHMAASYPPFDDMVQTFLDAHALSMALPAQMAFVALVGQGMLDPLSRSQNWVYGIRRRVDLLYGRANGSLSGEG